MNSYSRLSTANSEGDMRDMKRKLKQGVDWDSDHVDDGDVINASTSPNDQHYFRKDGSNRHRNRQK